MYGYIMYIVTLFIDMYRHMVMFYFVKCTGTTVQGYVLHCHVYMVLVTLLKYKLLSCTGKWGHVPVHRKQHVCIPGTHVYVCVAHTYYVYMCGHMSCMNVLCKYDVCTTYVHIY